MQTVDQKLLVSIRSLQAVDSSMYPGDATKEDIKESYALVSVGDESEFLNEEP